MNTKGSKKARKDFFTGMGFILPSLLGFLIFTFIPVVISLCLSFTSRGIRWPICAAAVLCSQI